MVRVLTFTTLFPNAEQPNHGVFVENRLRHTLALGGIESTVLAPVAYFPFASPLFGRYARYARVPKEETRSSLRVLHPRYPVLPKLPALTPKFLYRSARGAVHRLARQGIGFDVIDAHYFYPDGVAAAHLACEFGLPLVITGRGTDLTLIPQNAGARREILWAADQAAALVTVCQSLKDRLVELGVAESRVRVMRNGIDLDLFTPRGRATARARLGLKSFTLLSVGSLIARKGHSLILGALPMLCDCTLLIAGSGPLEHELERKAAQLGVASRVTMLGEVPHGQLAEIYAAADLLVLASSREGWANVLLESMACGTPVVASNVDGTTEVVRSEAAGRLFEARTPQAIAGAIRAVRASPPDRALTRRYAEQFGWEPTARANRELLIELGRAKTASSSVNQECPKNSIQCNNIAISASTPTP